MLLTAWDSPQRTPISDRTVSSFAFTNSRNILGRIQWAQDTFSRSGVRAQQAAVGPTQWRGFLSGPARRLLSVLRGATNKQTNQDTWATRPAGVHKAQTLPSRPSQRATALASRARELQVCTADRPAGPNCPPRQAASSPTRRSQHLHSCQRTGTIVVFLLLLIIKQV